MLKINQVFRQFSRTIDHIPTLKQFLSKTSQPVESTPEQATKQGSFHIETYGCQMNENDSEIVRSILRKNYLEVPKEQADIILINTCAIREAAEDKIHRRVAELRKSKIIGILGCMAERIKQKMFEKGVHVVCGPDAYRDLPRLIDLAFNKEHSMNVQLSVDETYADITPVRKNVENVSAFLSIMRGCNNMCSFCIVPFVRGRERSRSLDTILKQIEGLQSQGVREITFLGQNVNSYHDTSSDFYAQHQNSQGFSQMFKLRDVPGYRFEHLLEHAAKAFPDIRFRFTSPHPKDFPEKLLETIASHHNICNHIHLPAQSGNTEVLFRMRRNHTREAYLNLVQRMRSMIPNIAISTDMMCGFCGETEEQFQDTISLIDEVRYDNAFLFAYSMRERTHAHRNYQDDVPEKVKKERLKRMIDTFEETLAQTTGKDQGKRHCLLIEKPSKKDENRMTGKTDTFKKGYLDRQGELPLIGNNTIKSYRQHKPGDYVAVRVVETSARALQCEGVAIVESLKDYHQSSALLDAIEERKKKIEMAGSNI